MDKMGVMVHDVLQDLVTLLVVINPISKVPLFIVLAGHLPADRQTRIAVRAVTIAAIVLLFFLVCGQVALNYLGIDLASVQIAGGLILLIIGLRMVLEDARDPPSSPASDDIAVFPLAMPFIAGPGAIMSVMVLTDDNLYTLRDQAETSLATLFVLIATLGCLLGANGLNRMLGRTGINVISRILGLILSSLAVQAILTGVREVMLR